MLKSLKMICAMRAIEIHFSVDDRLTGKMIMLNNELVQSTVKTIVEK